VFGRLFERGVLWQDQKIMLLLRISNGEAVLQYLESDNVRKEGLEAAWVP
jgi:hypothetical protein